MKRIFKIFFLLSVTIAVNLAAVPPTAAAPSCFIKGNSTGSDPTTVCCGSGPGCLTTLPAPGAPIALGGGCDHGTGNSDTINASFPRHANDSFGNHIPTGWECGYNDSTTTAYVDCCTLPAGWTCHMVSNSGSGSNIGVRCDTANGEFAVGGGCNAPHGNNLQISQPNPSSVTYITSNHPSGTSNKHIPKAWYCQWYDSSAITAYVICCKV